MSEVVALTSKEAAERAGVSVQYLKRAHGAGKLPALGKNALGWLLFDPAAIDAWTAGRQARDAGQRVPVESADDAQAT